MKRVFTSVPICFFSLVTIFLGGCFFFEESRFIESGKKAVADRLFDPKATEFRNIRTFLDKEILCGEVNGKNKYGAYVGFADFVAWRLSTKIGWYVIVDSEDKENHVEYERIGNVCLNNNIDRISLNNSLNDRFGYCLFPRLTAASYRLTMSRTRAKPSKDTMLKIVGLIA